MLACMKQSIIIPEGSLVGMDPPGERNAKRTIRAELVVGQDLLLPIYYHKRNDDATVPR